jgi:hypothetical protein
VDRTEAIARAILRRRGVEQAFDALAEELSPSELTSVLLAVSRQRAKARRWQDAFAQYQRSSMFAPSGVEGRALHELRRAAFSAAEGFEAVEVAPIQPLGTNACAGIDPNNVLAATRQAEVIADPTSQLALEAARRRLRSRDATLRLAACTRVMRLQPVDVPGYKPHFLIFVLVSAGKAVADERFEREEIALHASVYAKLLRSRAVPLQRIELSDTRAVEALVQTRIPRDVLREEVRGHRPGSGNDVLARFGLDLPRASLDPAADLQRMAAPAADVARHGRLAKETMEPLAASTGAPVVADLGRLWGLGYYAGLRLCVVAGHPEGDAAIADGGVVTWTQTMLGDARERLVTSGFGLELLGVRW